MELEHLRAFVETVRRGSFSLAAEALSLSQPAVSRRIARLEAELGHRLLERRRPVATPTRAGLALFTFAERTLAEWDTLRPSLGPAGAPAGALQIAASSAPAEAILPRVLAEFSRRHPDIAAHVHVMNSDTVEECVRARHCDVGLLGRAPKSPFLYHQVIARDEVLLALPSDHRLAGQGEVDVAELAGEAFVVREAGSGTSEAVAATLSASQVQLPPTRVAAEVSDAQLQLAAIAAGQGVGFVSLLLAERARGTGLALLRLKGHRIQRAIHLVYDSHRLPGPARVFVEFVTARAAIGGRPQ